MSGINNMLKVSNGEGIRVMVIDTGVSLDNVINKNKVIATYNVISGGAEPYDDANHGTAIVNLIQSVSPESDIEVVKVLDGLGKGTAQSIYQGLSLALSKKVDILCLSLGTNSELSVSTKKLLTYIVKSGTIVVSASGNYNRNYLQSPSSFKGVVSVGGLNYEFEDKWIYSNYNIEMDFVSPAENIPTRGVVREVIEERNGTSFSNAIVVGQISLILSYCKKNNISITKEDILGLGSNEKRTLLTGGGYLDMNKFLKEYKEGGKNNV